MVIGKIHVWSAGMPAGDNRSRIPHHGDEKQAFIGQENTLDVSSVRRFFAQVECLAIGNWFENGNFMLMTPAETVGVP
jgi:hypothetical protein